MEKKIIDMMEIVSYMQMGELRDELELAEKANDPLSCLVKTVVQNEINKRKGKRHITLEHAKRYYEKQLTAE